jgi:hypothetical protein
MGISKPYQKNQVHELIQHIRPTNNTIPSPESYKAGAPNIGAHWYPSTIHRPSRASIMELTGDKHFTLAPGLQLSTIPLLNTAHSICHSSGPSKPVPGTSPEPQTSPEPEQLCDWVPNIISKHLQ